MKSLKKCCKVAFLVIVLGTIEVLSDPKLLVTNNGPTILDSNVTFSAVLLNYESSDRLKYVFNDNFQKTEYITESHTFNISRSFPSSHYKEGFYSMNIQVVTDVLFFEKTVASNSSRFELKRDLIGTISVHRKDQAGDVDEVAVGENVSITVDLIDNSNYLQKAAIDYSWSVDFEKQRTLENTLIYNFTDAGVKDIKASVIADFPNNVRKYGVFERTVTVKVPVNNVNVSGNPFLYHGDTLNLNVTCNGTPPFIYCYEVIKNNASTGNFSCSHLSTFTTCRMEIIKYFQNDGTYQIGIYVSNNVKEVKRVIEVMVYSVTLLVLWIIPLQNLCESSSEELNAVLVSIKPTLSTIIIPIVCSLLTLVIIAFGIGYYVQHRNQLAVEVANFDFQDDSNSYVERTFFENILDSFSCGSCACNRMSCGIASEAEPLM